MILFASISGSALAYFPGCTQHEHQLPGARFPLPQPFGKLMGLPWPAWLRCLQGPSAEETPSRPWRLTEASARLIVLLGTGRLPLPAGFPDVFHIPCVATWPSCARNRAPGNGRSPTAAMMLVLSNSSVHRGLSACKRLARMNPSRPNEKFLQSDSRMAGGAFRKESLVFGSRNQHRIGGHDDRASHPHGLSGANRRRLGRGLLFSV